MSTPKPPRQNVFDQMLLLGGWWPCGGREAKAIGNDFCLSKCPRRNAHVTKTKAAKKAAEAEQAAQKANAEDKGEDN